jgi:hypothetical protein
MSNREKVKIMVAKHELHQNKLEITKSSVGQHMKWRNPIMGEVKKTRTRIVGAK